MAIIKKSGGKSEEEKFKDALHYLPFLLVRFPEYANFQLHEIISNFKEADSDSRKAMIDCQNQLNTLMKENYFIKEGTFNLQLQLTDIGRLERNRLIEEEKITKIKENQSPDQFSFNEYVNIVIQLLFKQSNPLIYASIWHTLSDLYPYLPLNEVLAEINRLDLLDVNIDKRGNKTYLLRQPTKRKISNLQKNFEGKPYEYFISEEEKKQNENSEKNFLELQKLRDEVLDYKIKIEREKNHFKIALGVAILEAVGLIIAFFTIMK
ncbi:MAG: hypothetical protein JNK20_13575 [Flavipsychrobacter sp.]|nr:hypothetical protein [Flavipsychrobacter sp.]